MAMDNLENEFLSAEKIEQELNTRLFELSNLLFLKEKALKGAPEGTLRISKSNGSFQYFLRKSPGDARGTYIPAKNLKLAQRLAQKDYDQKISRAAAHEIKLLKYILRLYSCLQKKNHIVENIFSKLTNGSKRLVAPVRLEAEAFAANWLSLSYEHKTFSPETPPQYTAKGERVRSKSEAIIADTLDRMNIPYRYEFPLQIKNENGEKLTLYPDFLCLNLRTRQEFYWEHFGMMDDAVYAGKATARLRLYEKNKIFLGSKLIISCESSALPINTKAIEAIAKQFLL